MKVTKACAIYPHESCRRPAWCAHCFGLKMLKMGIKVITISPLPVCDTYFGTRAQTFSILLVDFEAVPMYDSASFTEAVAMYIHASCSCPTRCTPVFGGIKGVKWA